MSTKQKSSKRADVAKPMRENACIVAYIRFLDDNMIPIYSRDVEYREKNKERFHNEPYWAERFLKMIETGNFGKWGNSVKEAAIYEWNGQRKGLKLAQYYNVSHWDRELKYYH